MQRGIPYIVAPYEADAQMAFLILNGYADFVITEDSDLLVYGSKEVEGASLPHYADFNTFHLHIRTLADY